LATGDRERRIEVSKKIDQSGSKLSKLRRKDRNRQGRRQGSPRGRDKNSTRRTKSGGKKGGTPMEPRKISLGGARTPDGTGLLAATLDRLAAKRIPSQGLNRGGRGVPSKEYSKALTGLKKSTLLARENAEDQKTVPVGEKVRPGREKRNSLDGKEGLVKKKGKEKLQDKGIWKTTVGPVGEKQLDWPM